MKKFKELFETGKFFRIQYTTQFPIIVKILDSGEDWVKVHYRSATSDTIGKTLIFQIPNIVFAEDVTGSEAHNTNF